MDENCPDAPANFKLCTKSQQMSLARKRRFQSLGLKYADSQEVRDRLTMIEKRVSSFGKILSEQRYRFPILHGKYPV